MLEYPSEEVLAERIPGLSSSELIRTGGQKAVYKAEIDGQLVALKLLMVPDEALAQEEEAIEEGDFTHEERGLDINTVVRRAQREVAILEQVDVPVLARRGPLGLSQPIGIGDAQWLYFTEEWIEGEDLQTITRRGSLPHNLVAQLGVDLIQAVCWLFGRGLIHRDIKPANVMWATDRSRFVLLDPGIALDLHGPSLTLAPIPVGTFAYFSPEQMDVANKHSLDFRSDLFAIGIVLYECAVAEHPFMSSGNSPGQVLFGIREVVPQALTQRVQGFPQVLSEFITRLLAKAPHQRYRRCELALAAIMEIAESLEVPS